MIGIKIIISQESEDGNTYNTTIEREMEDFENFREFKAEIVTKIEQIKEMLRYKNKAPQAEQEQNEA